MSVSIVTQTGVKPESAEAFARWQGETSTTIAAFPGFIEQRLMPPKPTSKSSTIRSRPRTLAPPTLGTKSPKP